MSQTQQLHTPRCILCGKVLTLGESARGGMCAACSAKAATPQRGACLLTAHEVINGERQDTYGNPENCFATIAALWNAYLGHGQSGQAGGHKRISGHDAAVMLSLLKVARIAHGTDHADNYVDAAGYMALAADLAQQQ